MALQCPAIAGSRSVMRTSDGPSVSGRFNPGHLLPAVHSQRLYFIKMLEPIANFQDPTSLSDNVELYNRIASAADFTFYQHLGVYDEIYCHPDCVLLFPDDQSVYWFDLDHVAVSSYPKGRRQHRSWDLACRKFAFHATTNEKSIIEFELSGSRFRSLSGFQTQRGKSVSYSFGPSFEKIVEFVPGMQPQLDVLEQRWRLGYRLKAMVDFGNVLLLYPVRMVFQENGIFSFASKTVVGPRLDQKVFCWNDARLANVCATSDGYCSIYRIRHTHSRVKALLSTQFYSLAKAAYSVFHPTNGMKEVIRVPANKLFGPLLELLAPFEIQHVRCQTVIFGMAPNDVLRHS
jgi:hypothetical protein